MDSSVVVPSETIVMAVVFLLVEKNGDKIVPYKETEYDEVECDDKLSKFKDAVKLKYTNKLKHLDAPELKVFKTKEDVGIDAKELEFDESVSGHDTKQKALYVLVPESLPEIKSVSFRKATMEDIHHATGIKDITLVWESIPVDNTVDPSPDFVELFKKNCETFDFQSEAGKRTIIDLFLREIVYLFKPFLMIVCEYQMSFENGVKRRRLNGASDYTICHKEFRDLPHLVGIEAKYLSTVSLNQCIAACSTIYATRKSKMMQNLTVYGIHSTGENWKFMNISTEGTVFISGNIPLSIGKYDEEQFNHIYRLCHYVIKQSYLNSPRTSQNTSNLNLNE